MMEAARRTLEARMDSIEKRTASLEESLKHGWRRLRRG